MDPMRILVVDDSEDILALLDLTLRRFGYEVVMARDGRQAVEQFQQWMPDAVLLDINLPKLNGWEVCRTIKQERPVPVLMITGNATAGITTGAPGPDALIGKPFDIIALIGRMRSMIDQHGLCSVR